MNKRPVSSGYTLIELLIVTVLLAVLVLGSSALFVNTLNHKLRLTLNQEIKKEGEYILDQTSFFIRNAREVIDPNPCNGSSQAVLTLKNFDTGVTTFQLISSPGITRVASTSASLVPPFDAYLSSSEYLVSNLSFTCNINPNKKPYITVTFELVRQAAAVDAVSRSFTRTTLMRNPISQY